MVVKGEIVEDSSRNLLQRFVGGTSVDAPPDVPSGGGNTCEVELGLGLSLNGCFGVEPKGKRLIRSSSISSLSIFPTEHNVPLTRTCSLPGETDVERRKRKAMESLKRMEAKRKRSEKKAVAANGEVGRWVMGKWVNGVSRIASLGSSCSSSTSDFDCKPNIAMVPSASNHTDQGVSTAANIAREGDEPSKKKSCDRESERSMMEEMPSVSTKGDGPEGRRIEGFLYKYQKGEVRIVCVCHGQFLTPAEFVKHASGGDVAHPLRHIVVNRTPPLL